MVLEQIIFSFSTMGMLAKRMSETLDRWFLHANYAFSRKNTFENYEGRTLSALMHPVFRPNFAHSYFTVLAGGAAFTSNMTC